MRARKFDRSEMDRLLAGGFTQTEVARELGVTSSAISQAVRRRDPGRKTEMNRYQREWQREHKRKPCKAGCGRLVWQIGNRSGMCRRCYELARNEDVRPSMLRCSDCGEWKVDDQFPRQRARIVRRGRATQCRVCQTIARQDYRERHKQPCESCGSPALPPNEKGLRGRRDRVLCRACYRTSDEFRQTLEKGRAKAVKARRKVAA